MGSGPGSRTVTMGVFVVAVVLLAGGLVFLCASASRGAYASVALVLMVLGTACALWAGARLRQARNMAPEVMEQRIVDLAAAQEGEVTAAQVVAALDVGPARAQEALARMQAGGLARREMREGKEVYILPGLTESKVVRRCTYCGNEYAVREAVYKCPNCGGTLELKVEG